MDGVLGCKAQRGRRRPGGAAGCCRAPPCSMTVPLSPVALVPGWAEHPGVGAGGLGTARENQGADGRVQRHRGLEA